MEHERKVGIRKGNNSSKRKSAFSRAKQKMKEEMDQAWKDFFEKNPDMNEKDIRRRIKERLRSKQE
jgi:hypothetical protein